MHALPSTSFFTLASLLALVSSSPVARSQTPYFEVRHFSFSNSTTSARYALNISFPQDVVISPADGGIPTYTIPGFTDPVACTGTYFYSPSEDSTITPINACGHIGDSSKKVTTKFDVVQGKLYMEYAFNTTDGQTQEVYLWDAVQTGLMPVDTSAMEGFNTPAEGRVEKW